MSSVAAPASPHRIKQKHRRVRWRTSGRTVYAYVGNNPISLIDPLGLHCTFLQRALNAVKHFGESIILQQLNNTLTLEAGAGAGVEADVSVHQVGSYIVIDGRFGGGLGLGFVVADSVNYTAGHPSGVNISLSGTSKNPRVPSTVANWRRTRGATQ